MSSKVLSQTPNLTLAAAQAATAACAKKSQEIGVPMNIAVVDSSLYLLSFTRMPGAKLTSVDISINKAFTAAGHRVPTHVYKEVVWPGGAAYGINNSNGGRFMVIGGGIPVIVEGQCVGAIGCSTGTPDQDRQVAQAGIDAILELLKREGKLQAKL